MATGKKHTRFKFKRQFSSEPMTSAEWARIEEMLAKLIAQAYAEENPELFQNMNSNDSKDKKSRYDEVKE